MTGNARGAGLVELLTALAVAALVGMMVLPFLTNVQSQSLVEISRNDLQDRADRLIRFLANDIREAAFLTGPLPYQADGTPLALVHDSLAGDPLEPLPWALRPENGGADADDALTLVKALSFSPPLLLSEAAANGATELTLNRAPNRAPGSSRELQPFPEAISHLLLANQPACYPVQAAGTVTVLAQALRQAVPAGTELLGVRAYRYLREPLASGGRLRRDDFTSAEIFDDAIDGLQFEYLMADGRILDLPPELHDVRGVRISLLVRDLRTDRDHVDRRRYQVGDRSYGPYADHYRRVVVSQLVEVKNHGG